MLRLDDVQVSYDDEPVLSGVDLTVADGEILALLGPSGSGKSTLLRAIAGFEPVSGTLSWDGHDLRGTPAHKRRFALMFQDGQLFDHLSVGANVGYALKLRRTPRAQAAVRVQELLDLVDLGGYAERMPRTLSGGQRQRVALARALAADPVLLLLDEPLSSLDADLRERLAGQIREILRASDTSAIWVTHDRAEAERVADRVVLLE
ncbi:MAG: ABC transporter ATP-binding protein [Nocardioides sp.]